MNDTQERVDVLSAVDALDDQGESSVGVGEPRRSNVPTRSETLNAAPDGRAENTLGTSGTQKFLVQATVVSTIIFTEKNHHPGCSFVHRHL